MAKTKNTPLAPGEWIVELKILRRVRVGALDEIDAENEAIAQLSASDRAATTDVRIAAGRYEDGKDYQSREDHWWAPMHKNM